jgi:hypothetical protein
MNKSVEDKLISCLFSLSDPNNGAQVEIMFDEKKQTIQIQAIGTIIVAHSMSIDNFMSMPIDVFCSLSRSIVKDAGIAA